MVKKFGMDKCYRRGNVIKNYSAESLKQQEYSNDVNVHDDYKKAFGVISPLSNVLLIQKTIRKYQWKSKGGKECHIS